MITPYLNFGGNCREAMAFYAGVFGTEVGDVLSYGDYVPAGLESPPADLADWVLHAVMDICGTRCWFADEAAEPVSPGTMVKLTATVATKAEAMEVYGKLAQGATITLPPTPTFYSACHAALIDRFGVSWNVVCEEAPDGVPEFTGAS